MDRRALLRGGVGVAGLAGLSGCLDTTLDAVHGNVEFLVSFPRPHPADQPLVVDGLQADGQRDRHARLLTSRPREPVFTDAIEDVAPNMRSRVRKDNYDERFHLVAELRFEEPMGLTLDPAVRPRWKSWRRLRVPASTEHLDDPDERLHETDSVVATTLVIFGHEGTVPETLAMPVTGPDGGHAATLWAT